jgi:hypothetical protein
LDDTLRRTAGQWQIDLLDDVLPWDFCPSLFNYRRYFDAVMQSLGTSSPRIETLIAVILASLNHYRSKYAAEMVGERTDIEYAAEAVRLDPGFAEYVVQYCRLLVTRGERADHLEAAAHLQRLASFSARQLEVLDIARVCRKGSRTAGMANSRLVQSACGSRHTIVSNSWNRSHAGRARSAIGARPIGLPS